MDMKLCHFIYQGGKCYCILLKRRDGVKIASKKLVHKAAEATGGEFTGHRMADEVREIFKNQLFHQNKDRKS